MDAPDLNAFPVRLVRWASPYPDWHVFCAPRPLDGHEAWFSEWVCGRHFAAVDPAREDSARLLNDLLESKATLLVYVDDAQLRTLLRRYYAAFDNEALAREVLPIIDAMEPEALYKTALGIRFNYNFIRGENK